MSSSGRRTRKSKHCKPLLCLLQRVWRPASTGRLPVGSLKQCREGLRRPRRSAGTSHVRSVFVYFKIDTVNQLLIDQSISSTVNICKLLFASVIQIFGNDVWLKNEFGTAHGPVDKVVNRPFVISLLMMFSFPSRIHSWLQAHLNIWIDLAWLLMGQ